MSEIHTKKPRQLIVIAIISFLVGLLVGLTALAIVQNHEHKSYTLSTTVRESTCSNAGVYVNYCWCGYEIKYNTPPTSHSFSITSLKEPTCTEIGISIKQCTECAHMNAIINTDSFGHNMVDGICIKCGDVDYSKELQYNLSASKSYFIVSDIGDCTDSNIIIPNEHNGLPVKKIESKAFFGCTGFTNIIIPNSITNIEDSAFYLCKNLLSITFKGTIEEWNAISFGSAWNYGISATEVICSDGVVTLN